MQESLEASLVRIHTPDGLVVGAGFVVGERHILTCAHVVAGALGLADDAPEKPQDLVAFDVPRVAPKQMLTARVVLWRPPLLDGGDDLAGLELEGDLPKGAQAAPLAQVEDLWEHSFRAFGFPRGQDSGVWATGRLLGRQVTNWVQIEDTKETGFAVEPGFSGTPVWDPQVEAVVGMVVAAEKRMNLKTAFAIPVDVLARSWPLLESLIHPFVFLCYARADSDLVTRLKTDLLGQGVKVWIDREGLQPGTLDWEEALRTAIRSARAVLLIASPNARGSRYVRDELRIAELYRRPVYPLWIAGTQWIDTVPLGWGGVQYLDARESHYEMAVPELVALLDKASSQPAKAPELDFEPRNPYKGLRAFTGDDAHDFFGRDTLINELTTTLEGTLSSEVKYQQCARLLAVVGSSGSGKSSVVMAGLLPRLREGRLPGSEQWVYLDPIVPGARPIEALTLALSEHLPDKSLRAIREDLEDDAARGLHLLATKLAKRPGTKVVLLVDQFEELFTQTPSEDERRHFLDLLVTATTEPHGSVIVLLTLRADFYDRPLAYPALGQLIPSHQMVVLPMSIHELREVIEKPAALSDVRLTFEGDLVGDLLFEVQGQVGALPLLQFTLDQLFQRRSGSQLTLSSYRELGGVKGALIRKAEETYAALPSDEHRTLARALFVRLIDPGASEQDTTRRRAALSEFSLPEARQTRLLQEVIDAFIVARLLTTAEIGGTTSIEVSHEALIREWKRFAEWLREAREDIRLQQTISDDAAEWEQRNKPGDRLYRGSQLKEARAWARRNNPSGNEVAFLRSGVARRIRYFASVIMIVLLLLLTTGIAGWFLTRNPTYVTSLNDDGSGSLRQDIALATPGSTITFDTSLRGTIQLYSNDLNIAKNLTIRGPGAGILSISSGKSGYVVHVLQGVTVTFSGLTFRDSRTSKGFIDNEGSLTLTNSSVSDNSALYRSIVGGIYNTGTLTLANSIISGNAASYGSGGGIAVGGIYNNGGTLMVYNSTISGNMAQYGSGGGIDNDNGGSLTLTNSTISGNTATDNGGGIDNDGSLTLTNSTISGNTATGNGGGIDNTSTGSLTLTNSTISGNTATGIGGGIGITGTSINNGFGTGTLGGNNRTLMLTNSTISGNTATGDGGGIGIAGTSTDANPTGVLLFFCTLYGNTADVGGGIWGAENSSNFVYTQASIVAGNKAHTYPDISTIVGLSDYNLVGNFSDALLPNFLTNTRSTNVLGISFTALKIDPVLRENGGSGQFHTWTHALLTGSPAIDAIPLQYCRQAYFSYGGQYLITSDQRGMKRPDGNEQFCDIGAYESP
jgi:hypothetical protein